MRLLPPVAALCCLLTSSITAADSNVTIPQTSQQIIRGSFKPSQVFRNVNLLRNINLEKGYVRETINMVIENVDSQPQSEYYLPFEYNTIAKVGGLEVRDKKALEKGEFKIEVSSTETILYDDEELNTPTQYFVIHLPEPLAPSQQLTLSMSYHLLSSLHPLPASINQADKQYLTYTFSSYFPSSYPTLKQKTKLKFPTTDIPEYTTTTGLKSSADPERQGSTYTYGPYDTEKVPAGTTYPVTVRYEFTKPILACSVLERDVEVSHWGGNLATEERYWLRNDGAKLLNHFNRVTWALTAISNTPTSALRELKVPLQPGSVDPYFTDDIGNVSTSRYRPNAVRDALLELRPRYPVFGGWHYSFRIGWNNALSSFLRKVAVGDTYVLKVPFIEGPKVPEGVQYEHVDVRVILPEGARNVKFETVGGVGMPMEVRAEMNLHKTFMDTVGRTVLKLSAYNAVDEAREGEITVSYDYPYFAGFRKPLTIFAGVLGVFAAAWGIGQIDVSIGKR